MTSHKHIMCNDRVVEATYQIEKTKNIKYDIIVNVQGDLPMIFPDMIDKLVMRLAFFIALFDRIVVNDTGVDGTAFSVRASANVIRYIQTGRVFTYAMAMVIGIVGLVSIWWLAL